MFQKILRSVTIFGKTDQLVRKKKKFFIVPLPLTSSDDTAVKLRSQSKTPVIEYALLYFISISVRARATISTRT